MTSDTGAWRQTIYYPYWLTGKYGRGTVLQTQVECPTYKNKQFGDVPFVDCVAVYNEEQEELVIFAVNKSLEEDLPLAMDLRQFADFAIKEHVVLHHEDRYAINTEENPGNVAPAASGDAAATDGKLSATLGKMSWNMIRMSK